MHLKNSYKNHISSKRKSVIETVVNKIKEYGNKRKYDCLIGVSGGRDSSYLVWWVKKQGLRALLVHLDNGWNSEFAVKNVQSLCKFTGYDLHTHVIYTFFYQNYILPVKFKVDKRYAHYSILINSGQITREQAISLLKQPLYSEHQLKEDKAIF